jgi:hypothetical protein
VSEEQPRSDAAQEATRVLDAARAEDVPMRLVGGLAVALHATGGLHPAVARPYKDLDLVTVKGKSKQAAQFLEGLGYEPNRQFNATNGHRRLLLYDTANSRQVDVFVGTFEMCHTIPIADRLELDPVTIPLAELLLTKLQVFQLNEKDQRDILALLHHHTVGDSDDDTINGDYIGRLLGSDWGLWRTTKLNVERTREGLGGYGFDDAERATIQQRLDELWERIESAPKSTKWKLRDRVGDRVRWYEEPEEVD